MFITRFYGLTGFFDKYNVYQMFSRFCQFYHHSILQFNDCRFYLIFAAFFLPQCQIAALPIYF